MSDLTEVRSPPLAGPDEPAPPVTVPVSIRGIVTALAGKGWCVTPDFLAPGLVDELRRELDAVLADGGFRDAGVGRGPQREVRPEVRTDRVHWLDPLECTPARSRYLSALEELRLAINAALFLGLFEFEAHLAVYPPGTYYRRHLDQFAGSGTRRVTCVCYLNADWQDPDGGQLRLYTAPDDPSHFEDIAPLGGTLVTFLSARFPHEVLPAKRDRLSITGWFRTRE